MFNIRKWWHELTGHDPRKAALIRRVERFPRNHDWEMNRALEPYGIKVRLSSTHFYVQSQTCHPKGEALALKVRHTVVPTMSGAIKPITVLTVPDMDVAEKIADLVELHAPEIRQMKRDQIKRDRTFEEQARQNWLDNTLTPKTKDE